MARSCEHADTECRPCFKARIASIGVSPSATPSRVVSGSAPPDPGNNSWEKGIPKDDRGVPFLDHKGGVCYQKEVVENRSRWRHFGEKIVVS